MIPPRIIDLEWSQEVSRTHTHTTRKPLAKNKTPLYWRSTDVIQLHTVKKSRTELAIIAKRCILRMVQVVLLNVNHHFTRDSGVRKGVAGGMQGRRRREGRASSRPLWFLLAANK